MEEPIRLSKLLSQRGICSRREADDYIEKGWIYVEGECITTLGTKVLSNANVTLKKELCKVQQNKVTILLNKPLGYVSCLPEKGYSAAIDLITRENQDTYFSSTPLKPFHLSKLSVAGRLDINSKGLLVLTQSGAIAKQLIGEDSNIEKEYFVRISGILTDEKLALLEYGLSLDDKPLKRAIVKPITPQTFTIILLEGKKRQIRRMCELVDLDAVELKRIRIGKILLGKLSTGQWRFLEPYESFI
jgi:23S rRNA pseudouridine2604 synthase